MANSMLWAPQLETETHVSSVKFNVYKNILHPITATYFKVIMSRLKHVIIALG